MRFKDILVHVDASEQSLRRIELAVKIAREHGAQLTALHAVTHHFYRPEHEGRFEQIEKIEADFKRLSDGINSSWILADWQVAGVTAVEIVNYYSHFKDLTIVGQASASPHEKVSERDLPERVVLGSGRPVLVVPYAGGFDAIGRKIIVSWKAGRASARAMNDAMPFLLAADEVYLLEIHSPDQQPNAAISPRDNVADHLRRHGIKVVEEQLVTGGITVANILMNYAWENGCDMIVMGAFSSSSRGTVNLGPVADQMLDLMTLPVLMSN